MQSLEGSAPVQAAALGRVIVGLTLFALPKWAAGAWIGPEAHRPGVATLARAAGARDALLGLGTLATLRAGQPARHWVQISAAVDATDAVLSLVAFLRERRARLLLVAGFAAASAASLARIAARMD